MKPPAKQRKGSRDGAADQAAAEALAIKALKFLAADTERLGVFLALSGIGPESIRAAAGEPHFLAGVLDHVASDERLLLAFAADQAIDPAEVERAHAAISGRSRDAP
jgi:Protein of unknown function (DUF3572)